MDLLLKKAGDDLNVPPLMIAIVGNTGQSLEPLSTSMAIHVGPPNAGDDCASRTATKGPNRMPSGLYIGGGVQWSQLSTTNYSKEAWRTALGVGKDVLHDTYSLRLQALYVTKGTDKLNGTQGPEISLTYLSPTTNHRFFFRPVLGIYYFHTTITDFSDLLLMKAQGRDHHVTGYMAYEFVFRF
jgi:hypothetical protein